MRDKSFSVFFLIDQSQIINETTFLGKKLFRESARHGYSLFCLIIFHCKNEENAQINYALADRERIILPEADFKNSRCHFDSKRRSMRNTQT